MFLAPPDNVPENPVKFKFLRVAPDAATVSVPADILMLNALDSVAPAENPMLSVRVPVDPEYVKSSKGVPVYVKLVMIRISQTVALLPVTTIFPVPNAMDRVRELLEVNAVQVMVLLLQSIVLSIN